MPGQRRDAAPQQVVPEHRAAVDRDRPEGGGKNPSEIRGGSRAEAAQLEEGYHLGLHNGGVVRAGVVLEVGQNSIGIEQPRHVQCHLAKNRAWGPLVAHHDAGADGFQGTASQHGAPELLHEAHNAVAFPELHLEPSKADIVADRIQQQAGTLPSLGFVQHAVEEAELEVFHRHGNSEGIRHGLNHRQCRCACQKLGAWAPDWFAATPP